MNRAIIYPSHLHGTLTAPPSKSITQRALALALLHQGQTVIQNPGNSRDELTALKIIQSLGAQVNKGNNDWVIRSNGKVNVPGKLNFGESGLAFRMFAPIVASVDHEVTLTGEGSLMSRPMYYFDTIFPSLNVSCLSLNGCIPLVIKGPLVPGDIVTDGSLSSQYLTGLLFAFAAFTHSEVTLTVRGLKSKPYIDLSLSMLEQFGYHLKRRGYDEFHIYPKSPNTNDVFVTVEGDWSSMAFMLVGAAISGSLKIEGLSPDSLQGDSKIMEVLENCGVNLERNNSGVTIHSTDSLRAFEFDATDTPDLIPPLVALAANCEGISIIKGTERLHGKESDRAVALVDIFGQMGISLEINGNVLMVTGGICEGGSINSHNDHRIVMAGAIAGLRAKKELRISDPSVVDKSYPRFFDDLVSLGVKLNYE